MSTTDSDLDRLCGDLATHDGAVEAAAEDNSAANWKSALENDAGYYDEGELPWYGDGSPSYGSNPTPAQIEAARRFVSHWLEGDSHGFIIPGSEWGRSLKHWLHMLVATPAPGGEDMAYEPKPTISEEYFRGVSLLEQVKQRRIGPNHWIHILQWQIKQDFRVQHGYVLDDTEVADALAEAKRMKAEDEAATSSMLGRNY